MRLPSVPSSETSPSHPKARQTLRTSVGEFCRVLNVCLRCTANAWRTWSRSAVNSGLSVGFGFAAGAAGSLACFAASEGFAAGFDATSPAQAATPIERDKTAAETPSDKHLPWIWLMVGSFDCLVRDLWPRLFTKTTRGLTIRLLSVC